MFTGWLGRLFGHNGHDVQDEEACQKYRTIDPELAEELLLTHTPRPYDFWVNTQRHEARIWTPDDCTPTEVDELVNMALRRLIFDKAPTDVDVVIRIESPTPQFNITFETEVIDIPLDPALLLLSALESLEEDGDGNAPANDGQTHPVWEQAGKNIGEVILPEIQGVLDTYKAYGLDAVTQYDRYVDSAVVALYVYENETIDGLPDVDPDVFVAGTSAACAFEDGLTQCCDRPACMTNFALQVLVSYREDLELDDNTTDEPLDEQEALPA